jgi:hypothetical protein
MQNSSFEKDAHYAALHSHLSSWALGKARDMSSDPHSKIPGQFRDIYDELRSEITWMHGRWLTYRELFADNPKRIELLNEAAGAFFYIIQDVLLDEIQITLSKLTDPAKTGKHQNLSLEQLQSQLNAHGDPGLSAQCRSTLDALLTKCAAFRERRHKQLAHLDLATSLKLSSQPLPAISQSMIEDALKSVRDYMNAIEGHYNDSEWGYEDFIMRDGADTLLITLRDGLRYEELVQERTLEFDDWRKGKWSDA